MQQGTIVSEEPTTLLAMEINLVYQFYHNCIFFLYTIFHISNR